MRIFKLIICLFIASSLFSISFGPDIFSLGDGISVSSAEFWSLGFAPINVIAALLLAAVSIMAYRGNQIAFKLCKFWMGLYSSVFAVLLVYHFPTGWLWTVASGFFSSIIWYYMMSYCSIECTAKARVT